MKTVKLYEVTERKVALLDEADAIAYREWMLDRDYTTLTPDGFMHAVAKDIALDVHQILRIDGSPDYIALSPRLYEILEAPIKAKLDSLQARNDRLNATNTKLLESKVKLQQEWSYRCEGLHKEVFKLYGLLDNIKELRSQPWYKRVWRALRKDL